MSQTRGVLKQLGIIIVTYKSERHVAPLLASLAATVDPAKTEIWILDNASPDGTLTALDLALANFPLKAHLIRSETNLGFMWANNQAYARLMAETPCENIALLNPDTVVHAGWWQPLVKELQDPAVGTVASLLLLPDGTINSRGNAVHFLGLGFVQGYGEPVADLPADPKLFFASGAAMAFCPSVLDKLNAAQGTTSIFWEDLFLYADDTDLGWRMRMAGLENRLVPESRVTHDHRFWLDPADDSDRLFYIERNRYLLMFANFKQATLFLLMPWLVASEIALGLGLWKLYPHRSRLRSAVRDEIIKPEFQERRRRVQAGRTVRDRDILRAMTGSIRHGALPFRWSDRLMDAALRASHRVLGWLIWW